MKLTDYIIIFVIITIPFVLLTNTKTRNTGYMIEEKIWLDRVIDTAIVDASNVLVSYDNGDRIVLDKDRAINTFYNTLYLNLGIVDSDILKAKVMGYIPIIIISESDGFYIVAKEEYYDENGELVIGDVIHEKVYYSLTKDSYTYLFSIADNLRVIDTDTNTVYKGTRQDIGSSINTEILSDEAVFEETRDRVINQSIQDEINYYIAKHNSLKVRLGIAYEFHANLEENGNWNETLNGINFIAIFQGMPYNNLEQYYANVSVGGARLGRDSKYFIERDTTSNLYYYHRENCSYLSGYDLPVDSCSEAAREGAFPCDNCLP